MNYMIIRTIDIFVDVVKYLIIARILVGLFLRDTRHPVMNFLYQVTEPILEPFRRLLYKLNIDTGMFDFSPILAFLALELIEKIIIGILL
ncbi:YggT family protein [Clostridiaceae bacterium M8S5]|nr:YggT family protein [Clostridiaceae bacterium M8S5]